MNFLSHFSNPEILTQVNCAVLAPQISAVVLGASDVVVILAVTNPQGQNRLLPPFKPALLCNRGCPQFPPECWYKGCPGHYISNKTPSSNNPATASMSPSEMVRMKASGQTVVLSVRETQPSVFTLNSILKCQLSPLLRSH